MNAVDRAYRSLRTGILAGRYDFADRLGEVETAEALGVSRTPVREALRRLAAEGLVEFVPNRGACVATWTTRDVEEVYDLRVCLESYGAAQAASRAAEEDLAQLSDLCDQEETVVARVGDDGTEALDLKAEYHRTVMRLSSNQRLYDMVTPLIDVQHVLRIFRRSPRKRLLHQIDEHRVLLEALQVGDPEWAAAVMRAHLIGTKEALLEDKRQSEEDARAGLTG